MVIAKTALQITPEERAGYRVGEAIERHRLAGQEAAQERWRLARHVAGDAALLLKQEFSARRVAVFGSAARPETFTPWSDLDLAVWGIPPARFYAAVAAVSETNSMIGVDVVDPEHCGARLRAAIEGSCVDV
jgi:predicted nucleotidyltransferase